MPTYVCTVPAGLLDSAQKDDIAKAISIRHSEATGAPESFVQVVIHDDLASRRYLGGEPSSNYIWIRGDIREGRSEQTRTAMMQAILEDVSRISTIPQDSIWVYICNLAPTDMIEYGQVLPVPGAEANWFTRLPNALRDRLTSLGTTKDGFTL
jgi:phenylpyruvate tautomerase PptA (4-oxalocrotonate tautomerase family)